MVNYPEEHRWSSYHSNVLGKESALCTPHSEYLRLGKTEEERLENYRQLFRYHFEPDSLDAIRKSVNKGLALGDNRFKEQIGENFRRRVTSLKVGRKRAEILL